MRENVKLAGYTVPTPIQQYVLPAIFKGHDVVACAQTGLCFLVLLYENMLTVRTFSRFGKDCGFPDSNLVKAHGQGQEACCLPWQSCKHERG
jgi:hypothetical protein